MLLREIATLDEILEAHATELGKDWTAYRNHTYRVANLCAVLSSSGSDGASEPIRKIAIAAAFHDLGIWTDRTFDYLRPSIQAAGAHLAQAGREEWTPEITAMILEHHKISSWKGNPAWLVEPFRRADWVDVTRLRTFGLPRSLLREIFTTWPDAGFHKMLLQLELKRLRTHPWNPLPMVRL